MFVFVGESGKEIPGQKRTEEEGSSTEFHREMDCGHQAFRLSHLSRQR